VDHPVAFENRYAFRALLVNALLPELGVPVLPAALVAGGRVASGAIDPLLLVSAIVAWRP